METILLLTMMILVAAISGFVGSFALMKRMALASDAISHVALPGLAIAMLLEINPLLGGLAALVAGAILIWLVERQTAISTETVIGVVFATSLAIGALLTPAHELEEVLFGEITAPGLVEGIIGSLAAIAIGIILLAYKEKIVMAMVSSDLAKTLGLNVSRLNLLFLLLFSVNVLLGLRFLGVLLMGALVIVPAAAAKNLARNLNADFIISSLLAVISVVAGFLIASAYDLDLGPAVIIAAAVIFVLSMLIKPLLKNLYKTAP